MSKALESRCLFQGMELSLFRDWDCDEHGSVLYERWQILAETPSEVRVLWESADEQLAWQVFAAVPQIVTAAIFIAADTAGVGPGRPEPPAA